MKLGFLFLNVFIFCKVAGLRHDGTNVCSRMEEREQKYTEQVTRKVPVTKKIKCWDIDQNFKCDKVYYEDRQFEEEKTRIVEVPVYFCCPGYHLLGEKCVRRSDIANHWTASPGGCQCYFEPNKDCACCVDGGCQCGEKYPKKCIQCGYGHMCLPVYDQLARRGVAAWTLSESGCACDGSRATGPCPCCQHGGCQCKEGNTKRCKQCGSLRTCDDRPNT